MPLLVGLVSNETMHRVIVEGLADWGEPAFQALEEILPTQDGRPLASVVGLLARILDEERNVAEVDESLCEGCGACVAACMNKACEIKNLTSRQVGAMVERLSV